MLSALFGFGSVASGAGAVGRGCLGCDWRIQCAGSVALRKQGRMRPAGPQHGAATQHAAQNCSVEWRDRPSIASPGLSVGPPIQLCSQMALPWRQEVFLHSPHQAREHVPLLTGHGIKHVNVPNKQRGEQQALLDRCRALVAALPPDGSVCCHFSLAK